MAELLYAHSGEMAGIYDLGLGWFTHVNPAGVQLLAYPSEAAFLADPNHALRTPPWTPAQWHQLCDQTRREGHHELEAERDAHNVVGVWYVQNLLKVRAVHFIADLDISASIEQALARDPYVGSFDFSVYVHNGKASLYGQVGSHFEQQQVGEVAAGVNGVAALDNRVSVAASPTYDDFAGYSPQANVDFILAERIRSRWFWSPSLHNQGIEVLVEDGRATLTGTVDTWFDHEKSAADAFDVGADFVDTKLVVATASGC